jgi:hypothetical protein
VALANIPLYAPASCLFSENSRLSSFLEAVYQNWQSIEGVNSSGNCNATSQGSPTQINCRDKLVNITSESGDRSELGQQQPESPEWSRVGGSGGYKTAISLVHADGGPADLVVGERQNMAPTNRDKKSKCVVS